MVTGAVFLLPAGPKLQPLFPGVPGFAPGLCSGLALPQLS